MSVLVIGADGQLGSEFIEHAREANHDITGLTHDDIEIADAEKLETVLDEHSFDTIINTAAYHGYNAYKDLKPKRYYEVNAFGPFFLGQYAKKNDKTLVHYSTDYVFGGSSSDESFSEDDTPTPINMYGASKLAGENLLAISGCRYYAIRVASVYGAKGCKAKDHSNFVEMILAKLSRGEAAEVVDDIYMSPTSTRAIVVNTYELLKKGRRGLYHMAGSGRCSWYEFALEVARLSRGSTESIRRISSHNMPQSIKRANNTALVNAKLGELGISLKPWQEYIAEYIERKHFSPERGQTR